ncbi:unnamed protein product [Prorocentrum cordatum]|uniref:Uncharacterized protein n=1 Tax=Prorocentrum cordatum TaxID=2364126 RepID=A0ABN9SQX6_9DINO|nr:unnamed protein product [Polarella glacialis]
MPTVSDKLRRDVALHSAAEGLDVVSASARQLRAARRGPRLGGPGRAVPQEGKAIEVEMCVAAPVARLPPVLAAEAPRPERGPVQLRAEAAPFWPRRPPGCWTMLGPARVDVLLAALGVEPAVEVADGTAWQVTDGSDLPAGSGHKLEEMAECMRKYGAALSEAERGGLREHAGGAKCLVTGGRGLLAASVGNAEADLEEEEFVSDGSECSSALGEDADVEAKLVADGVVSVSEEVGDGIEGATLDGVDGGVDEKGKPAVELEALAGRLGALVEGAEPAVELKGDLAALSARQGALEESAEAKCELAALSQRPCALAATSEQLVSQKGGLAALSEQQGTLAEGAEPTGEREVLSRPLNALEALCEQRGAKMASRRAFSESLFFFLDDFAVTAMMRAAIGPKSGVESLLSSAEARFIDVRPGSAGWPDGEERERILESRLQVVQMPRGVRGPLDE